MSACFLLAVPLAVSLLVGGGLWAACSLTDRRRGGEPR